MLCYYPSAVYKVTSRPIADCRSLYSYYLPMYCRDLPSNHLPKANPIFPSTKFLPTCQRGHTAYLHPSYAMLAARMLSHSYLAASTVTHHPSPERYILPLNPIHQIYAPSRPKYLSAYSTHSTRSSLRISMTRLCFSSSRSTCILPLPTNLPHSGAEHK